MTVCPRCRTATDVAADEETGLTRCGSCGLRFDPHQAATGTAVVRSAVAAADQDIDGYRLTHLLGTGGMSEVWAASAPGRQQLVAVKLLRAEFSQDREQRARFRREVQVLRQLDHPGIVRVLSSGEHAGRPYLVSDLVAGGSLRDVLRKQGRLSPERVHVIAQQVLAALVHAHARGCVHRDLKPENLLVRDNGSLCLCDFGIARLRQGADGRPLTQLTRTDAVLGTLAYMAPEQREPGRSVDGRCDLYALGMVVYEALSGHRPEGRFEEPRRYLDSMPADQADIWNAYILRLLARDPAGRPADAAAALASLPPPPHAVARQPTTIGTRTVADVRYPHGRRLLRDSDRAWLGGLAAGLATWYGIAPFWLRMVLIIAVPMTGGLALIGYLVGIIVVRPCRNGPYRPRPLAIDLPHRPPGWLAGICALMARETGMAAGLWRLLLGIVLVTTGWPVVLGYLLMALLLPSTRKQAAAPPPPQAVPAPSEPTAVLLRAPQRGRTWFIASVMLGACAWSLLLHASNHQDQAFSVLIGAAVLTVCAALLPSLLLFRSRLGSCLAGAALWAAPAIAFAGSAGGNGMLTLATIWLLGLLALSLLIRRYAVVPVALTLAMIVLILGAPSGRLPWFGLAAGGLAPSTVLLAMLPGIWLADAIVGLLLGRRALTSGFSLVGSLLALVTMALLIISLLGEHTWWWHSDSASPLLEAPSRLQDQGSWDFYRH